MATILFDLDGTLVDTAPDLLATTNAVLSEEGVEPVHRNTLNHLVGQGGRAMLDRALRTRERSPSPADLDRMVERFLAVYREGIPGSSAPFHGVEATLDALATAGHRFAVCTNKFEELSVALLDALVLRDRFAAVCGPDTFGVRKPDPDHVLRTIELAGGSRDAAVMVGDSYNDIEAARRAGVPSIGVTFGYTDIPVSELGADLVVETFGAITPEAIERLLDRA